MKVKYIVSIAVLIVILALVQNVSATGYMDGANWTGIDSILDSSGYAFLKNNSVLNAALLTGTPAALDYPNNTVGSKEAIWDAKTTLTDVNTSALLGGTAQVTGLVSALVGKEPTITGSTNSVFWNGAKDWITLGIGNITGLQGLEDAQNASITANSNIISANQDNWNATYNSTYGAITNTVNGNLANWNATYNATYDAKTTLTIVNSSALLAGMSQVTGLDTALSGKESAITGSTNNVFWNGLKQWITLGIGNITGLQTSLDEKLPIATYGTDFPNTTATYGEGSILFTNGTSDIATGYVVQKRAMYNGVITGLYADSIETGSINITVTNATLGTYKGSVVVTASNTGSSTGLSYAFTNGEMLNYTIISNTGIHQVTFTQKHTK